MKLRMTDITRRGFLGFLGGGIAAAAAPSLARTSAEAASPALTFTPVRLPHPLPVYTKLPSALAQGIGSIALLEPTSSASVPAFNVVDDVVVPPQYERYLILQWGDRVYPNPSDYAGYNHDYTTYIPLNGDRDGLLFVNHEYLSYPFSELAPETPPGFTRNAFATVIGFPLPTTVNRELLGESLYNCGASIVRIRRRRASGRFEVVARDHRNRRVHGLSGLAINRERKDRHAAVTAWGDRDHQKGDDRYLIGTGPAAIEVFERVNADGLGNRIIGTFANCSGATTPWGTVLSAEENFHATKTLYVGVQEGMLPNGSQQDYFPGSSGEEFGLVGEKYGWMVEIHPRNPADTARKHTALGRFRHENAALRVQPGHRLVAYLGDDRRGGHVWKYVSRALVERPEDPANTALLADGVLHVARFHADGTGRWIPLLLQTPTDPTSPTSISQPQFDAEGRRDRDGRVILPRRPGTPGDGAPGGFTIVDVTNEAEKLPFYRRKTLADFYDTQGAVLCDAFPAGNLVGGTPCARPEDIEVHPATGEVFIAMTDGVAGADGYADARIFTVSKYGGDPGATQPSGGLYKIIEDAADSSGLAFRWERYAQGGEAGSIDGVGFANVDNLAFDPAGNLWGVTDMPTERHNAIETGPEPKLLGVRHSDAGSKQANNLVGVFGNNWLFVIPARGPYAGAVVPFASGPVRCEMTGPTFVGNTLILSVQHPGEDSPIHPDIAPIAYDIELLALDGGTFRQRRVVPSGSRWPSNINGDPTMLPRPAVVGIRKLFGIAEWEADEA
jgi:secreted PhoX family phosphatase